MQSSFSFFFLFFLDISVSLSFAYVGSLRLRVEHNPRCRRRLGHWRRCYEKSVAIWSLQLLQALASASASLVCLFYGMWSIYQLWAYEHPV
ncbi:hypothetical protein P154DRAFT_3275 [Amniculicola lignicola CBS 123094]|uniref:Uncharacterized protein n=1 Tax=Amniculicola lignicola CBS 123094 TaxID=1392246 RepID=A0A6A5X499_9PLEO|nr:hypothetical protein P154DRAFT_3275 [Amniculicola lignicola CBS 123094]